MELRQLKHFLAVVRCASFGEAAKSLNLTQPALSKSIKNLETSLQVSLLERNRTGVQPTVFGEVLLDYATLVSNELDRAVDEINALRGARRGAVRVGAGPSLIRTLVSEAARAFLAKNPDMKLTVLEGLRPDLEASLRRGELDLIVASIGENSSDPDFNTAILFSDRMTIVAAADHPLAGRRGLTLNDLNPYAWILPTRNETEKSRLVRVFQRRGLKEPKIAVETTSSQIMATLLPGTDYLSYLPVNLVRGDAPYAGLVEVECETVLPPTEIAIRSRRRSVVLPGMSRFIAELRVAAKQRVG